MTNYRIGRNCFWVESKVENTELARKPLAN